MARGILTTLRRTVAVAAIGLVLTSPAMLAGCDDGGGFNGPVPPSQSASAAQSNPNGSVAKSVARSSIFAAILDVLRRERDSSQAVIRNLN